MTEIASTVRELEEQTWDALSKSGRDLLPFLSEDCVFLFPLGMKISHTTSPNLTTVMTSEAYEPWKSWKMKDVQIIPMGKEGAVIIYEAEAKRAGMEEPFKALISSTWRRDSKSGHFLMCVHQQTPFQDVDPADLDH